VTELVAIVRRSRATATKRELERIGCQGYTAFPVLGRGKQRGLKLAGAGIQGLGFLPKVLFTIVVRDEAVDETVEAVMRANQTGEFGDGKIFALPTAEEYRISDDTATAEGAHS
jgi:nitrogen regulatory protein PII 2